MAPEIPSSKITLSCPLFAAGFDPRNDGFLLVGGGGGEGRSGVGNKIALLNTSKRTDISEVVDIELSRDEDSVTSLAVARADDKSITALAGINSSQAEQKKNNNEHLRSFRLDYPPRKALSSEVAEAPKYTGKTTALSRSSLFRPPQLKKGEVPETYQKILRLSPWKDETSPRIGVIASGLAPAGELVVFRATSSPTQSDVLLRVRLGERDEAEDVDIIDKGEGRFVVAYISNNGRDVSTFEVSASAKPSSATPDTKVVYSLNTAVKKKKGTLPKFRALRFLTPEHLVVLENAPDRSGASLLTLSATTSSITQRRRLRRTVKIGLGLDVCHLSSSPSGERQLIVAASGSDNSIEILTLDYVPTSKRVTKFRPYTVLKDVHPFSMTQLTFSNFIPPPMPVTPQTRPQHVRLASTSMGNTVVVHTFPLLPYPAVYNKTPRYVLITPGMSHAWETVFSSIMAILVVAISAFLLQAFTEIRGGTPETLGAKNWLTPQIRDWIAKPYIFENGIPGRDHSLSATSQAQPASTVPVIKTPPQPLRDLLSGIPADTESVANADADATASPIPVVVVRDDDGEVSAQVYADGAAVNKDHKKFEDLSQEQQHAWKRKLSAAGHWAADEGETILKGIFFGELGGLVGQAVAAGL